MIPLIVGFLVAGPASGWLSDRFGARPFATGGMLLAARAPLLIALPVSFSYVWFAASSSSTASGSAFSPRRTARGS